jgi:predicted DNA-binding protein with PD1-like motif
MRTLKQPGPVSQPRLVALPAEAAQELRVVLPAGSDLHQGLVSTLRDAGITDAAIRITGGSFASMQYLTGQPDASGARVATYGAPTLLAGPVLLIGASAILGRLENGDPILHCHAVVADRDGRTHGGHLPPGECIAGPEGLTAWVTVLAGGGFAVGYDAETNYQIFQPRAGA